MIYEHEIPKGSKLYFGKSAKLKRKIENIASEVLEDEGFKEIVTPFLSYHQHNYINEKQLLRFSDHDNHVVALRADSTLDVIRIVKKRLGRTTEHKRWFYIQPVFRYPSSEVYQIGGELIGENSLGLSIKIAEKIFTHLDMHPILQISNITIPKQLSSMLDIPLRIFKEGNLETLLNQKEPWLKTLTTLQKIEDIDKAIMQVPPSLKKPLEQMKGLAKSYKGKVILAPLYYTKMRYYDALFFRIIHNNSTLSIGGNYTFEELTSSGFGLYIDDIIEFLTKQDRK